MSYFVYDNWTRSKAIVHRSNCSFCNEGRGIHGNPDNKNSKWHGPFEKLSAADEKAKSLIRETTGYCRFCTP